MLFQPGCKQLLHRSQMACEEMIRTLNEGELFRISCGSNNLREPMSGRKLVVIAADEKLGYGEFFEGGITINSIAVLSGKAEGDQGSNISGLAFATGGDGHGCSEA